MQSFFNSEISKENIIDILDHEQSYVNVNSITVDSDIINTGTFMIRRGNTIATLCMEIKLDANELCEILRISNLKQRLLRE